jgi:hypothetical protein
MLGVLIAGLLKSVNLVGSGAEPPKPEDILKETCVNHRLRYQVELRWMEYSGVKSGSTEYAMKYAAAVLLNVLWMLSWWTCNNQTMNNTWMFSMKATWATWSTHDWIRSLMKSVREHMHMKTYWRCNLTPALGWMGILKTLLNILYDVWSVATVHWNYLWNEWYCEWTKIWSSWPLKCIENKTWKLSSSLNLTVIMKLAVKTVWNSKRSWSNTNELQLNAILAWNVR